MLLDTEPDTSTYDYAPNLGYPSQKMSPEIISLDNDDGVGDLRGDCLEGLRKLPWTPYTAYGVGGPVGGINTSLITLVRNILVQMTPSSADRHLQICATKWNETSKDVWDSKYVT